MTDGSDMCSLHISELERREANKEAREADMWHAQVVADDGIQCPDCDKDLSKW